MEPTSPQSPVARRQSWWAVWLVLALALAAEGAVLGQAIARREALGGPLYYSVATLEGVLIWLTAGAFFWLNVAALIGVEGAPAKQAREGAYWAAVWAVITGAIIAAGALIGAVLGVVHGLAFGSDSGLGGSLRYGVSLGWRYARVWAGGVAFILCFVKAHEKFSVRTWWKTRREKRNSKNKLS